MLIGRTTIGLAKSVQGFSLIELMVSMLIGMIVAAGAVTLIVAINDSNSQTIKSTRLTQEMRALSAVIADDVKRTRRVGDPISVIAQGTTNSCLTKTPAQPCYPITPTSGNSASCLTYGYSLTDTTPGSSTFGLSEYVYRSVRLVTTSGVGSVVMDELKFNPNTISFDGLSGNSAGTDLPINSVITACPITGAQNSYTLTSVQMNVTALTFLNVNNSELDLTVTGQLIASEQDAYAKSRSQTMSRTFTQPIFMRADAIQ
jgi:prepilin-type N-terminal cleavage/methylation domain-containing protein